LIITISAFVFSGNVSRQVAGVSTSTDSEYTKVQLDSLAKTNPSSYQYAKYVAVLLRKDVNKNSKPDEGDCLAKKYTIKINGKERTPTQPSDCSRMFYKVTDNCNTIQFVKTNTANKYSFSYLEYQTALYKFSYVNKTTKTICGFPSVGGDETGYKYNQINFGVKGAN
jgi:hypothetical protein